MSSAGNLDIPRSLQQAGFDIQVYSESDGYPRCGHGPDGAVRLVSCSYSFGVLPAPGTTPIQFVPARRGRGIITHTATSVPIDGYGQFRLGCQFPAAGEVFLGHGVTGRKCCLLAINVGYDSVVTNETDSVVASMRMQSRAMKASSPEYQE